jgi:hypothetical protein
MPEFLVSDKYKEIFNEYDLSVIKAAHLFVPQDKIAADRKQFLARLRGLYPNPSQLPLSRQETIRKIESLSENDFFELMRTFRYA